MTTPSADTFTWVREETSFGDFKVSSISFDPQKPSRGQSVTVTATGELTTRITSGTVKATIRLGVVPLLRKESNLPTAAPGPYTSKITFPIPDTPGNYSGTLAFHDQDAREIALHTIGFSLS